MQSKTLVLLVAVTLGGCASTVPMNVISVPTDRTRDQMQLDDLQCHNMSQTSGPWLYGIGTAIYKSKAAEKYKECMKARGYDVERATNNDATHTAPMPVEPALVAQAHSAPPRAEAAPAATLIPALNAGDLAIALPEGWQQLDTTYDQRKSGLAISATNKTTDSDLLISRVNTSGITDRDVYAQSRLAAQENNLDNPTHSAIVTLSVNGRSAKRFEVTGIKDGTRVTYLDTLVFGQDEVVSVSSWTTAANYSYQKASFEVLAERISGIK